MPTNVVVNDSGDIFVADALAFGIKKYDSHGNFLMTIGRRGRAPGEIQNITGLSLDRDGHVVLADWRNARITSYSPSGEVVATQSFIDLQYVREFVDLGESFLILNQALRSDQGAGYIFHEYDKSFTTRITSFGRPDLVVQDDDDFVRTLGGIDIGSAIMLNKKQLLYAPKFYDGRLYIFNRTDMGWNDGGVVRGASGLSKAIEIVESPPFGRGYASVANRTRGVIFRNEDRGLFRLSSGLVIHFFVYQDGDDQVFGAEVFSPSGDFVGVSEIDRFQGEGPNKVGYYSIYPHWVDSDSDLVYALEYDQSGGTRVIVYRVTVSV
jgi:hypothetical protein